MIRIKRIYEEPSKEDGYRILIDRLWPRVLSKNKTKINLWLREIAPSDKLRKRFSHDPKRWKEFKNKYREELEKKKELIDKIKRYNKERETVTLLYSARDEKHNNALVLYEVLQGT